MLIIYFRNCNMALLIKYGAELKDDTPQFREYLRTVKDVGLHQKSSVFVAYQLMKKNLTGLCS